MDFSVHHLRNMARFFEPPGSSVMISSNVSLRESAIDEVSTVMVSLRSR